MSKIAQSGLNGQFRTPRHIIRMMVEMMNPSSDEVICDPACGTSGFLVAAGEYLKANKKDEIFFDKQKKDHYMNHMFYGYDMDRSIKSWFFKKVMSKAKFWQMIGRGTRLCPGLLDGEDKQKFYIFDFCGNFEFFRMNKGKATANMIALQGAIFNLKFEISYKLQDIDYQIDRLIAYRKALVKQMSEKVQELPRDNFAVRQHLKYVDLYATEANYQVLTYEDSTSLDSRQIYFVNQIVEYIVHNGMMKDLSVLQESPFTDQGSVVEIFTDLTVWMGIRKVIESINANAAA